MVYRRRHHALAVGAETGALQRTSMTFEQRDLLAVLGVPDAGGMVIGRRHHALAVGAETGTPHPRTVSEDVHHLLPAARDVAAGRRNLLRPVGAPDAGSEDHTLRHPALTLRAQ